ncbi:MAG: putative DNA-binding protein [Methanophagales archaeon]|nr:antitoxin family protein [Methanophagales archaeon]MCU4140774.1 putative DNA-binding protein [Methanophagales archaeon]
MAREIEAVYEKGVLKPLERLDLREGERVKVEIKRHERERVLERYVGRIKLDREVKLRDIYIGNEILKASGFERVRAGERRNYIGGYSRNSEDS